MTLRTALILMQHTTGVINAYSLVRTVFGEGVWWVGAVCGLCMLMVASSRIPPKEAG